MIESEVREEYFEWLEKLVCGKRYSRTISYRKLLEYLHSVEFTYSFYKDSNRAEDGVDLRYQFIFEHNIDRSVEEYLDGPCSIFEMLVALAIRCEEWLDDPAYGDRTGQWFWKMIVNLGLGGMEDSTFDKNETARAVKIFLNRKYKADGRGGLFTIRGFDGDMRDLEIWDQMCRWMDTIS